MLFEEFIEQHRVHSFVADGVRLALLVARHQIRIYLFHVLGHRAEMRCTLGINFRFVAEGHRSQCQDRFACLLHGFNLIFETLRGRRDAKSALVVYHNCPASDCGHTDARDKGGSLGSYGSDADDSRLSCNPGVAYIDIVAAGGEVKTSVGTDGDVGGTGCVAYQRVLTEGRVVAARGVIAECSLTAGYVKVASVVALKRLKAISRVVDVGRIATERLKTGRCVFVAPAVVRKCKGADGRLAEASSVAKERIVTENGVFVR